MQKRIRFSRRDCIAFGTLAAFAPRFVAPSYAGNRNARAKRLVLVWLDGGPSHLEMFDPKPEASAEVRGPLGVVKTKTPGIVFGEGLQSLAKCTDKFSVIRSMTSPVGEHNLATQYALSGHIPGGRAAVPAFPLPLSDHLADALPFPKHIAVPDFGLGGGSQLSGFLGNDMLPWSLRTEPGAKDYQLTLWPDGLDDLSSARLLQRKQLLEQMSASEKSPLQSVHGALDLLSDHRARQVFDLEQESSNTRARYGFKPVGQCCLLARRLLEAGVPMVTINNKGWDTHDRLHERLHAGYTGAKIPVGLIPSLDQAVSALLDDLYASGLIEETLVVVMGEFGRTPKINAAGGRDHWPRAYSVLVSGGGIRTGIIHGTSDRVGENADRDVVTPSDLVATIYELFGVDPFSYLTTPDGQQVRRVPERTQLVSALV
ncbi:MAG: DUF1501 domain-containing protein [Planctomycetales bacterium]|nr:DUF1501 domain-containing protein [Planctomycetales bacterium]